MVTKNSLSILIRIFGYSILAITFVFLVNNVLTVWFDWPGIKQLYSNYSLFGFKKLTKPLEGSALILSFIRLFFYFFSIVIVIFYSLINSFILSSSIVTSSSFFSTDRSNLINLNFP